MRRIALLATAFAAFAFPAPPASSRPSDAEMALNAAEGSYPFAELVCPGAPPDKAAAAEAEVREYLEELRSKRDRDAYMRERTRRTAAVCRAARKGR